MKKIGLILMLLLSITISMPISALEYKELKKEYLDRDLLIEYTEEAGELYDIDPYILQALVERESSLNINAVNKKGTCFGLCQINEYYHKDRMERNDVESLFDPRGNILVAADYLSELYDIKDDIYYALMRYNMKKSSANKMWENGEISKYALGIVERANELKMEDVKKNKKRTFSLKRLTLIEAPLKDFSTY